MKNAAKWIALLIICIFVLPLGACNIVNDGTVATINGEEITVAEYQYVLNMIGAEMEQQAATENVEDFWETEIDGKNALDVAKERAFDQIAQQVLVRQEAKKQGITLTQEDTDAINEQKSQVISQLGGRQGYEARLSELGIDDKIFSDLMDRQMFEQKMQQNLMETDERFQTPSDEQIQSVVQNEYIKAQHILFKTVDDNRQPLPQDQKDAAKAKAEETYQRIQNGEDFETLMRELSEDPGLASQPNGYIFTKGEMVEAFENAAFALQEGEISQVVESSLGYHIIKRVPIDLAQDIDDTVKQSVTSKILNENYEAYINDLESAATITKQDNIIKNMKIQQLSTQTQSSQSQGSTQ